jgi:hypothetical protein
MCRIRSSSDILASLFLPPFFLAIFGFLLFVQNVLLNLGISFQTHFGCSHGNRIPGDEGRWVDISDFRIRMDDEQILVERFRKNFINIPDGELFFRAVASFKLPITFFPQMTDPPTGT